MDLSELYQKVYEGSKKADKDYDGDGKVESGTAEYKGSVDKAIKASMKKRKVSEANIEYLGSLYERLIAADFNEAEATVICNAKRAEIEESVNCPVCGCDPCQCLEGSFTTDKSVEEAYTVTAADKKGNTKAYQNFKAGMKNKITGKPLYKAAPHLAKEELVQETLPALQKFVEVDDTLDEAVPLVAAGAGLLKGLAAKVGAKVAAKGGAKVLAKKALTKVKPLAKHVGAEVVADRISGAGTGNNQNTGTGMKDTSGY